MSGLRYPSLYQINIRVWLTELSRVLGRRATLEEFSQQSTAADRPERMALVSDEKWRDDALAFTAKGFRQTSVSFFSDVTHA